MTATQAQPIPEKIHAFKLEGLTGEEISLSDYAGRYMLIVNVASRCGYTPQYEDLEALYRKYPEQLVVIGLPCNQFGGQEPGTPEQIATFCEKNYGVTFPMTAKVDVKGSNQHPLYTWLTQKAYNKKQDSQVRWNFHKYLINPEGELVGVYPSSVSPVSDEIKKHFAGS